MNMRKALVKIHGEQAGVLTETEKKQYIFQYETEYTGPPVSLAMPLRKEAYLFESFPPYFDGVLPEGVQLEGLLKRYKLDSEDYFAQLCLTGSDLVGAVVVEEMNSLA
jgi:serine/threonine-protein kinase HipA